MQTIMESDHPYLLVSSVEDLRTLVLFLENLQPTVNFPTARRDIVNDVCFQTVLSFITPHRQHQMRDNIKNVGGIIKHTINTMALLISDDSSFEEKATSLCQELARNMQILVDSSRIVIEATCESVTRGLTSHVDDIFECVLRVMRIWMSGNTDALKQIGVCFNVCSCDDHSQIHMPTN